MDNVYVADSGNGRIVKFGPDGRFLAAFGARGAGDGRFEEGPFGVWVDPQGTVYVPDLTGHGIQLFRPGAAPSGTEANATQSGDGNTTVPANGTVPNGTANRTPTLTPFVPRRDGHGRQHHPVRDADPAALPPGARRRALRGARRSRSHGRPSLPVRSLIRSGGLVQTGTLFLSLPASFPQGFPSAAALPRCFRLALSRPLPCPESLYRSWIGDGRRRTRLIIDGPRGSCLVRRSLTSSSRGSALSRSP